MWILHLFWDHYEWPWMVHITQFPYITGSILDDNEFRGLTDEFSTFPRFCCSSLSPQSARTVCLYRGREGCISSFPFSCSITWIWESRISPEVKKWNQKKIWKKKRKKKIWCKETYCDTYPGQPATLSSAATSSHSLIPSLDIPPLSHPTPFCFSQWKHKLAFKSFQGISSTPKCSASLWFSIMMLMGPLRMSLAS